jgi:hypothetical protein
MSATKAQINWASVTFGSTAITRITTGGFGLGGKLLKFKGDTDIYSSIIANVDNEPHATFTTADVGTMMAFVPGAANTLSATLSDAKAATGGAVNFVMSNAVFENADTTAQHANWGTVTGTWQAFASDGTTNPLVIARS